MKETIYLDVFFLLNLLMDFIILRFSIWITGRKTGKARIIIATLLMTMYSCFALVIGLDGIIFTFTTYLLIPILSSIVLIGEMNIRESVKNMLAIYVISFLLNGIIELVNSAFHKKIVECKNASFMPVENSSIVMGILMMIVLIIILKEYFRSYIRDKKSIKDVWLFIGEQTINIKGLVDTGNSLRDPKTYKPVCVVERDIVDMKNVHNIIDLPFKAVGKSNGLMQGIRVDMIVDNKLYKRIPVGLYDGKFEEGKYKILLNRQFL